MNNSPSFHPALVVLISLLLSIIITCVGIKPLWGSRFGSAFYAIDPDVHYLSNAIGFIRNAQIQYIDHPGTPAILLMSLSLLPFRVYSKIALHQPFMDWSFLSLETVYVYSRYFQSIVFLLSLFLTLLAVHKYAHSWRSAFLVFLAFLSFTPSLFMTTSISPETTSFFLLSLWAVVYAFFANNAPGNRSLTVLGFISGVAIANKFTNLPLVGVTLLLPLTVNRIATSQKIKTIFLAIFFIVIGFISGTWPIRSKYPLLLRWVSTLSSSSGIHGEGKKSYFDLDTYRQSLRAQISTEPAMTLVILLVIVILIVKPGANPTTTSRSQQKLIYATLLFIFLFAKYPLTHYQIANYVLLLFLSSPRISRIPPTLVLLLISVFSLTATGKISKYTHFTSIDIKSSQQLEDYISSHPSQIATLWEWGKSKDFTLLWSRSWANGLYTEQIRQFRPDLLELTSDLRSVRKGSSLVPVFGICWDKLYIQEVTSTSFLNYYPKQALSYEPIPGTKMGVITSLHCSRPT